MYGSGLNELLSWLQPEHLTFADKIRFIRFIKHLLKKTTHVYMKSDGIGLDNDIAFIR